MLFTQIARVAVRQPVTQRQQRRTILNWMTNYPDRVRYQLKCPGVLYVIFWNPKCCYRIADLMSILE